MASGHETGEARRGAARQFAEALPTPVWAVDSRGDCDFANPAWSRCTGVSQAAARGAGWQAAVHPDDLPGLSDAWAGTASARPALDVRLKGADGAYRGFRLTVSPPDQPTDGLVWVFGVDVEDRRTAASPAQPPTTDAGAGLADSQLRTIIDTIPATVFCSLADGSDGFWNQRWRDYAGMTPREVADGGYLSVIHPDDLEAVVAAWREAMASGRAGEVEVRLRRADGAFRWFLSRWEPLRDTDGRITNWYGANTDIHERRLAEEALAAARADLGQMSRATSLGMLAAAIAHEVNQPLAGVVVNGETGLRMLSAEPPDLAGVQRTLERALRDGRRAADIVGRLRVLFQRDVAPSARVDLNETTRELMALVASELARHGAIVALELDAELPAARGDRISLQQVIQNLVVNAAEAMRQAPVRERNLTIRTRRRAGGHVELSVQDAGPGFAGEAPERLFDAFYTTKPSGMGIGLSIARQIIDRHGGRLWAEGVAEGGAVFTFTLPEAASPR